MPRMKWDKLNQRQLGQYGEYYAKMEFASYGYDVYTSEVDDHGVDFVARDIVTGTFYEVQVKSIYKGKYTYMQKQHMSVDDKYRLVCFLKFEDDRLPEVYIIPATAWQKPNAILVDRKYDKQGQKSKPEWGISYTIKNKKLIEKYKAENFFWLSIFIGGATMPFKIVRNDITRVRPFGTAHILKASCIFKLAG